MKTNDISELYKLANNSDRSSFAAKIQAITREAINQELKPCERQFYSGMIKPTNLIRIAMESGKPASCFYELAPLANPTKLMSQISTEITRASKKEGQVLTELIYSYWARAGEPFKSIKVTYVPVERDLR